MNEFSASFRSLHFCVFSRSTRMIPDVIGGHRNDNNVIFRLYACIILSMLSFALPIASFTDYAVDDLMISLQTSAIANALRSLIALFAAPLWGTFSDRIGRKKVMC